MATVNTCRLVKIVFMIVLINGSAQSELNKADNEKSISNENVSSIDSRFFDVGSLINQFLPGMNQGQGGPRTPDNSEYYPGNQNQIQGYDRPQRQSWNPVIDDAKTYPGKGRIDTKQVNFFGPQQSQYPNQGYPQNQIPGNGPTYFDRENSNPGNQYQNPNDQYFGGRNTINRPPYQQQYPNQNNFGNQYPPQGPVNGEQYPNPGNYGGTPMQYPGPVSPGQNNFGNQYPNTGPVNGGQYQRPGIGYPKSPPSSPDQNNFGNQFLSPGQVNGGQLPMQRPDGSINQYPNIRPANPNQNYFGNQYQNPGIMNGGQGIGSGGGLMNQYPQQGNIPPDQQNFNPGGGTLDGIVPSQPNDFNIPDNQNNNAILGKPVTVTMTAIPPDQIVYPENRTDDPPKKQCSQDCQTTTEYNPVCGSNGVTYYNPGRFFCARNCGINVFVSQKGRCPGESIRRPAQLFK